MCYLLSPGLTWAINGNQVKQLHSLIVLSRLFRRNPCRRDDLNNFSLFHHCRPYDECGITALVEMCFLHERAIKLQNMNVESMEGGLPTSVFLNNDILPLNRESHSIPHFLLSSGRPAKAYGNNSSLQTSSLILWAWRTSSDFT